MTAEGHCNIVWGGDFKDTLRFQTSNFSFSFDATFRFADYSSPLDRAQSLPTICRRSCPNKQKSAPQIYVWSALSFVGVESLIR